LWIKSKQFEIQWKYRKIIKIWSHKTKKIQKNFNWRKK
jgi:hypothetical protein